MAKECGTVLSNGGYWIIRKPHRLNRNKSTTTPHNIIFFDCETTNVKVSNTKSRPTLKLGWAAFARKDDNTHNYNTIWLKFTTHQEFWDFVTSRARPKTKLYLVAHNIGFDFRVLGGFRYTKQAGWKLKGFYSKGLTTLMRFTFNNCTIQLIDNTNFFPYSLEKLGKILDLHKLDINFESTEEKHLSVYCKRDVEIMLKAWETWFDFIHEHDLGNFRPTLPSTAFNSFRHRFMKHDIWIHDNEDVLKLERESYHGGRTECFKVGSYNTKSYYQVDVNSMYAFLMANYLYPSQLIGNRQSISVGGLAHKLSHYSVVANVDIHTTLPVFPIIHDKRLIYPIGSFNTTLSTPELKFALANDMVNKVNNLAWYRQEPIFKEYCEFFHNLKVGYETEDNFAFRHLCKLFNNSLYGKFGQRGLTQKLIGETTDNTLDRIRVFNVDTGKESIIFKLCGKIIEYTKEGESYNSFPTVASHVTAYGRIYLWNLFNLAGLDNVFYCDTDGAIVNQKGYDNLNSLMHPTDLGKLKLEHSADFIQINCSKDYILGTKVKHKGVRKNAIQLSENTYEQDQFMGLRGMLQSGKADEIIIETKRKTLQRNIFSGNVQPDKRVTPFVFPL